MIARESAADPRADLWDLLDRNMVWIMVALWAVMRIVMALTVKVTPDLGDSEYYLGMAQNLRDHGVHGSGLVPTSFRVPLYPLFIAALSHLPGDLPSNIVAGQSLLSLGSAIYAYRALRPCGPGTASLFGVLLAASPFTALIDFAIMSESLTASVLLVAVAFTLSRAGRSTWGGPIVAGLLFGALVLTKETFLLFPPGFLVALALLRHLTFRQTLLALAAFALAVAPWSLRNSRVLPKPTYALSQGVFGLTLWAGTWVRDVDWAIKKEFPPEAFDDPRDHRVAWREYYKVFETNDDSFFRTRAIARLKERPLEAFQVWLIRAPFMWKGTRSEIHEFRAPRGSLPWQAAKAALWGVNNLLLLLALAGAIVCAVRRRWIELAIASLPVLYTIGVYLPFYNTETRYSAAALPSLYWLAAIALAALASRFLTGRSRTPSAARSTRGLET